MRRIGTASFELDMLNSRVARVSDCLEVSLDCSRCSRRHRTIVFDRPNALGRCTPTRHEFDGLLLRVDANDAGAMALFRYEYEPFVDAKYPDERRYSGFEAGAPTWVRFHFVVVCAACGKESAATTQTNIVRPWHCMCSCGSVLYRELGVPHLAWSESQP